jgi:Zn ribbon nucleic-acid-binding protein
MPRAGAWYPVVGKASADRAVLDIRGRRVAIAKRLLEIRPERPTSFTVVIRPLEAAAQAPVRRSDRIYAVCPACTARVRVHREQLAAVCPQCRHRGEVAWWETG